MGFNRQLFQGLFVAAFLTGCAIVVTPKNFIYQSSKVEKLDTTRLQAKAYKDEVSLAIKPVSVVNSQGITLRGIQAIFPNAIANVVIYAGNGMTINKSVNLLHEFGKIPVNAIWFDYQGTGISDKSPRVTVGQIEADGLAVLDFAQEALRNDRPFLLHGISMGSILSTRLALKRNVDGVVLDGAVDTVGELVVDGSPGWSTWFTRTSLDPDLAVLNNGKQVQQYTGPLLLLVGDNDKTTPPAYSQAIYKQSASKNKELVVLSGRGHADVMKSPLAIEAYQQFIRSL